MASPMGEHVNGYDYAMDGGDFDPTDDGHHYNFGPGAEDAARELEESLLGASHRLSGSGLRDKGKSKGVGKRQALDAASDASSDLEIPMSYRKDRGGYANKRRKVEKGIYDITDDLERSVTVDHLSKYPGSISRVRGKVQQRELSYDSVSATPKVPRKKFGPRKKLDTFPPETLELLGLASGPTSISGDVTPSMSRPASPALTSSVVYELDDVIPALKRAKRVDDAAMLKRLKALEEAQRKVWTNIARRDVAKVRLSFYLLSHPHVFLRSTSSMPWATSQDNRSWSAWRDFVPSKLESHSQEHPNQTKIYRRKGSG
jgi:DNA helicase INO80